jgi:hypothetical protein
MENSTWKIWPVDMPPRLANSNVGQVKLYCIDAGIFLTNESSFQSLGSRSVQNV